MSVVDLLSSLRNQWIAFSFFASFISDLHQEASVVLQGHDAVTARRRGADRVVARGSPRPQGGLAMTGITQAMTGITQAMTGVMSGTAMLARARGFFLAVSQGTWCWLVGEFIRIPFSLSEPFDSDISGAGIAGELARAGVDRPCADDAVVSAVVRHSRENGAAGGAVSGGPFAAAWSSGGGFRDSFGGEQSLLRRCWSLAAPVWLAGADRLV